ncbi:MAG: recombinase family protein [Candidatus Sulfotelmatobacter sp.]
MKRVALYCRVSTVDQHPETQLLDLKKFVADRGDLHVVETYTDHGVSGTRSRRPALDKMLADARRHRFDMVIVWSVGCVLTTIYLFSGRCMSSGNWAQSQSATSFLQQMPAIPGASSSRHSLAYWARNLAAEQLVKRSLVQGTGFLDGDQSPP